MKNHLLLDEDRIVAAAMGVADTFIGRTWHDVGPALTCSEADALVELLDAAGCMDDARLLAMGHAAGDEEGDDHWTGDADASVSQAEADAILDGALADVLADRRVGPFSAPDECDHEGSLPCSQCCPCDECGALRAAGRES